jgi:FAD/FMN-containing dehydrogenase
MSAEIVRAFAGIVGAEHAMPMESRSASDSRALYASVLNGKTQHLCVVRPQDVEQLQQTLQLAAKHELGVSVQPNAAGTGVALAPEGRDALVLDLQRMNRIVEVSEKGAYALVEPGVSYAQLRKHLADRSLAFWVTC